MCQQDRSGARRTKASRASVLARAIDQDRQALIGRTLDTNRGEFPIAKRRRKVRGAGRWLTCLQCAPVLFFNPAQQTQRGASQVPQHCAQTVQSPLAVGQGNIVIILDQHAIKTRKNLTLIDLNAAARNHRTRLRNDQIPRRRFGARQDRSDKAADRNREAPRDRTHRQNPKQYRQPRHKAEQSKPLNF